MVFFVNDISAIRWRGDHPEQVVAFKADWENVLDNMDSKIEIKDEALKYIFYEQM
jgi:hypothetical protein